MKKPSKKLSVTLLGVSLCLLSVSGYLHYKRNEDVNRVLDKHLMLFYNEVDFSEVNIKDIDKINYNLNLDYDSDPMFTDDLVYLKDYENIRIKYYGLRANKSAAEQLVRFFEDIRKDVEVYEDIPKLEIRRAYCDSEIHVDVCPDVYDHKTGYDIDFQILGYSRTDFVGHVSGDYALNNLYNYGFVLRYADQPWHYRYVGKWNSYIMEETNKNIEEYIKIFKKNYIYEVRHAHRYFYKVTIKNDKIKVPKDKDYNVMSLSDTEYLIDFKV